MCYDGSQAYLRSTMPTRVKRKSIPIPRSMTPLQRVVRVPGHSQVVETLTDRKSGIQIQQTITNFVQRRFNVDPIKDPRDITTPSSSGPRGGFVPPSIRANASGPVLHQVEKQVGILQEAQSTLYDEFIQSVHCNVPRGASWRPRLSAGRGAFAGDRVRLYR